MNLSVERMRVSCVFSSKTKEVVIGPRRMRLVRVIEQIELVHERR